MTLPTNITIEQRDALYEQTLDHLSGIGDLWTAIEDEDFERAERLGREFADELRLLEDIGWGHGNEDSLLELSMPPEELHRVFTNLRAGNERLRLAEEREEAEAENEARELRSRAKLVTDACERVLSVVGRTPPPGPG